MCGRFTLTTTSSELAEVFELEEPDAADGGASGGGEDGEGGQLDLHPRYNIAPTQPVLAVRAAGGGREVVPLHWGLIPSWAKERSVGARMINARCESAADKPAYRDALRRRRCLIPASGFYEWGRRGRHSGPHWFAPPNGGLMAFAGLWERWQGEAGTLESCTILTTDANALVAPIHERMPVILERSAFRAWLDPELTDPREQVSWQRPPPEDALVVRKVSRRVNDVALDDAGCIEAAADDAPDWGPLFGGS